MLLYTSTFKIALRNFAIEMPCLRLPLNTAYVNSYSNFFCSQMKNLPGTQFRNRVNLAAQFRNCVNLAAQFRNWLAISNLCSAISKFRKFANCAEHIQKKTLMKD